MSQPAREAANMEDRPGEWVVPRYVSLTIRLYPINFILVRVYSLKLKSDGTTADAVSREHSDGSGPLFNIYMKMEKEEDNKMADRWQKDADGILIFVSCHLVSIPLCSAQPEHIL
jgi:hypothetical protein